LATTTDHSYNDKLVIGLYTASVDKGPDAQCIGKWWQYQESFVEHLGINIKSIAGYCREKSTGLTDRLYSLKRSRSRFENQINNGSLTWLNLQTMDTLPDGVLTSDWDYTSMFGILGTDHNAHIVYGFDMGLFNNITPQELNRLIHGLIADGFGFMDIKYGFCTIMPRNFLPGLYALGMGSSAAPEYLIRDANAWTIAGKKQCDTIIRNVYGLQVLNSQHFKLQVGDQPFNEWVISSPRHGRLIECHEDTFLWSFRSNADDVAYLQWNASAVVHSMKELMGYDFFLSQTLWKKRIS